MLIRMVEYTGNLGGGARFVLENLRALLRQHPEARFELVSYGAAFETYRALVHETGLDLELIHVKPDKRWRSTPPRRIMGVRGSARLLRLLGFGSGFHHVVPRDVLAGCDVIWLPWLHRHRLADPNMERVVGSFHDAIFFQFENVLPILTKDLLNDERETVQQWLASAARIVVSSNSTVNTMVEVFGVTPERFLVIPISGEHAKDNSKGELPPGWDSPAESFLICPANITPHKNHEILFEGVAAWGAKHPLVLTGAYSDLLPADSGRARDLRRLAKARGLEIGESLIPLGYVSNEVFFGLLSRSRALVMPTLAEGGGSFPVYEAMVHGIPVVCSDIPVIREQIQRTGGEVLWFDPHEAGDLAEKLQRLEQDYPYYKERAVRQVGELRRRSWEDVADDYWRVFASVAEGTG